jgi:hypothetical protein
MALTRIPAPAIADVREPNFRNIVINGDMAVAQRATSQASITTSGYYTLDRARTAINNGGTWTQSQSTEVPSGQGFATSLKMDCTTADSSLSSGDYLHVQYPIEAQNLQYLNYGTDSAQTLTLSFWVRSNKTGTYCICLQKSDNTRYDYVAEYSISSADTWEKKTIIIAPDSNIKAAGGAIDNDSGEGFKLKFTLLSSGRTGTNNTWNSSTPADATSNQVNLADSTSNEWYVTGVQLEAGSVATDFEVETFGQNLQRCQRYYEKSYNYADPPATTGSGGSNGLQFGGATANIDASVLMSVRKRAAPTLTVYDLAGTSNKASYYTGSWNNGGSLGGSRAKETYVHVDTNISSSTIVAWQYTAAAEL